MSLENSISISNFLWNTRVIAYFEVVALYPIRFSNGPTFDMKHGLVLALCSHEQVGVINTRSFRKQKHETSGAFRPNRLTCIGL